MIELTLVNHDQLGKHLDSLISKLKNAGPAFKLLAADFHKIETEQFTSQGARGGTRWKPLAESTLRSKRGPSIMIESGILYSSLVKEGARFSRAKIENGRLELGTSDPKAVFHQRGTRNMPARPLIKLTAEDRKRWAKIVMDHVVAQR